MFKFIDRHYFWLTLFASAIAFFLICGPAILDPSNDAWLLGGGDLTQQYFGWAFFRNSPWTLPLGLNPMYGMDISSSIVYSDGNPLLSLLFKLFNGLLPTTFQFQGLWLLICFLMQGYFAWKILGLYTEDSLSKTLGSILFIFTTPLLFRVGVHTNLAAHFLILGGLYLNLRTENKNQAYWWLMLLIISLGVHFYIFAMVFGLWIADLVDRIYSKKEFSAKDAFKPISTTLCLILFFAWQFGYFAVKAPSLFGYGFFKANLLSIFNPNGWSSFIKDLPIKSSWGEGNLYLGLGALILLFIGLVNARPWANLKSTVLLKNRALIIILFLLLLFSITNQFGLGSLELQVPLPEWLLKIFGVLRHSARLFWPIYYCILIAACVLVLRKFKISHVRLIFGFCLTLQIIDLSPGIIKLHLELNSSIKNDINFTPLRQPFWNVVSQHYKNIYILPSRSDPNPDFMSRFMASDWRIFGRYASLNKLNTNAVYMSRYDTKKQDDAFIRGVELVDKGEYDPETLYIIKNEDLIPVALGLRNQKILLAKIDGFNVLAPQFPESIDLNSIGHFSNIELNSFIPELHQEIPFKKSAVPVSSYALTRGWNNQEDWGAWSNGKDAVLTLPLPNLATNSITLTLRAFINGATPQQLVSISSEGKELGTFTLSKFENNLISLEIPKSAKKKGYITLDIKIPNAISPSSIGMSDDVRDLGMGIVTAKFD